MSLHDNLFAEDAEEDLKHFLESGKSKRVLIFPPVNNYRRFLIHQLVQDRFSDLLHTFSIGQGLARRTVVCYKSDFIRPPQVNGVSLDGVTGKTSSAMGIESQCTPTASPEHTAQKPRQVKSVPAVEIYRPPAARRARLEKSPAGPSPVEQTTSPTLDANSRANRQKRPDRAVYIPRHRRSAPDVEGSNVPVQEAQSRPPLRVKWKQSTDRIAVEQTVSKETPPSVVVSSPEKMEVEMIPKETPTIADTKVEEKIKDIVKLDTTPITTTADESQSEEEKNKEPSVCLDESDKRDRRKLVKMDEDDVSNAVIADDKIAVVLDDKIAVDDKTDPPTNVTESSDSGVIKINESKVQTTKQTTSPRRLENDKVINNKQTLIPQVLLISSSADEDNKEAKDTKPVVPMTPPEKKVKKVERPKSKPAPPPLPPSKINRDESDWDSLFDDNGDCLDPTLIEELTSSVGEVVIEKPKSSYKTYTRPVEVSSDEFGHVLEIYNFPSEFKSSDLSAVFSPFKSGGFELKWVDDTHCLGVFSSPLVAAEVLASDHPFVKTRPLSEATALSKTKARRSSEFLQPYRSRPETCAALARRLVTKSLGVTLATARQEREQEKILLREAKEKKRLANKQREDVWEGIIAEKPTS